MLYEALAGEPPFADSDAEAGPLTRVWRDAPSIGARVERMPPRLALLIDRLLARLPDARPASASEALRMLGRDPPLPRLAMVGRGAELTALVQAARDGRSLGIAADPGLGRTRLLEEAAAVLAAEGREILWLVGHELPYGSLRATLGLAGDVDPDGFRSRLEERLDAGAVVVVDPPDRVDPWSSALVATIRGAALGVAGPPSTGFALRPLTEEEQRDLFWGPDRVLHLREDGARELHRRARGIPAQLALVVGEWVEAGLARLEGDRIRLDPGAALRLADLPIRARALRVGDLPQEQPLRRLLPWIALAEGQADVTVLQRVSGRPEWEIALLVEQLVARGTVEVDSEGRLLPRPGMEAALALWTETERTHAHRALAAALPPNSRTRLPHLIQAGACDEVASEARALAAELTMEGHFARACHVLETALAVVRWRVPPDAERALLRDLVLAAFPAEDLRLRELASAAVRKSDPDRLDTELLQDLADAAVALARRHFSVAEGLMAELTAQEDEGLELARVTMLVEARTRASLDRADLELATWEEWAAGNDERTGRLLSWRGVVAYRLGRFEEAAVLHGRAARHRVDAHGRLGSRTNESMCHLEAGHFAEARQSAAEVVAGARRLGSAIGELRGSWIQRSIAYRTAADDRADREMVEVARRMGPAGAAAPSLFTEAAMAWREGDARLCRELIQLLEPWYTGNAVGQILIDGLKLCVGGFDLRPEQILDRLAPLPDSRARRQVLAIASALLGRADPAAGLTLERVAGVRWEIVGPEEIEKLATTHPGEAHADHSCE